MDDWKTPENKVMQTLFGPTISVKEIIITVAALIIIGGAVGIL